MFDDRKSLTFDLSAAPKPKTYRIDLAASPEYLGLITGLELEPITEAQPGARMAITSIVLLSAETSVKP